jgi:hypothetical protein
VCHLPIFSSDSPLTVRFTACGLISETFCINPLQKYIVNRAHIGFIILTVIFNILAPLFVIFRIWHIKRNVGYPDSPSQQRASSTIAIMVQTVVLYVVVAVGILPRVIPQLIRATALAALLEIVMQSGVVRHLLPASDDAADCIPP